MAVNFNEEKKLWKNGCKWVIGLDEAGRGPLAGPVVAAAVLITPHTQKHSGIMQNIRIFSSARGSMKQTKQTNKLEYVGMFLRMRDSKKLSEKQREYFYGILTNHENIKWGIGVVSEKVIDKINILEATRAAMKKAINDLGRKISGAKIKSDAKCFLLIDGNFGLKSKIAQKSIIKGDDKVFSIAAAGIIAKVERDKIMRRLHKKHPQYGFDMHKGYGTAMHIKNLMEFGPSKIHRRTFCPVKMRTA